MSDTKNQKLVSNLLKASKIRFFFIINFRVINNFIIYFNNSFFFQKKDLPLTFLKILFTSFRQEAKEL